MRCMLIVFIISSFIASYGSRDSHQSLLGDKLIEDSINTNLVFSLLDSTPKEKLLLLDSTVSAIRKTGTVVNKNIKVYTLSYNSNSAATAYSNIINQLAKLRMRSKPDNNSENVFFTFKAGMFVLLEKDYALTIIEYNLCANPSVTKKIREWLISNENCLEAILINCGAYNWEIVK